MKKNSMKYLPKIIEHAFYVLVFLLPWQTKIILRAGETNFQEIALYASHLLLLLILIGFFVYKLLYQNKEEKISGLWLALTALELGVFLSFFCATDQVLAFYHYLLFLVGIALYYLLSSGSMAIGYDEAMLSKAKILRYFFSGIFLQALLGIYQFLEQRTPVCKYLGLAAHHADIAGTAVVETASGRWLRAYGGFDHPNIFGGVLVISLLIAAYLLAKNKIIRSKGEALESVALFIFYFVALFALFFTFSRTAWLAFVFGSLVLLFSLIRQKDYWVLGRFLALVFFSMTMIFIVAYPYRDLLQTRITADTRLEQKSLSERRVYFSQAKSLLESSGLLGVGTGNYTIAVQRHDMESRDAWDYQPVHNSFLLVWAEEGILSLAGVLVFIFFLFKKNRREIFSTAILVALLTLMMFDHWLVSLPFGIIFFFFVLGLL